MIDGPSAVLDSSALLAFLRGEPGANTVAGALRRGAIMSAVNLEEVLTKVADAGLDPATHLQGLMEAGIVPGSLAIIPMDADAARASSSLRSATRRSGLSLGDRACLALARERGLPALTADRAWAGLVPGLKVVFLR